MDEDFTAMIVSAVRYALPRHSYMPWVTRNFIRNYWPLLKKHHWCILRDIRQQFKDTLWWWENHPETKFTSDEHDLAEWVHFYNYLITREDTEFPKGNDYLKEPITYERTKN